MTRKAAARLPPEPFPQGSVSPAHRKGRGTMPWGEGTGRKGGKKKLLSVARPSASREKGGRRNLSRWCSLLYYFSDEKAIWPKLNQIAEFGGLLGDQYLEPEGYLHTVRFQR